MADELPGVRRVPANLLYKWRALVAEWRLERHRKRTLDMRIEIETAKVPILAALQAERRQAVEDEQQCAFLLKRVQKAIAAHVGVSSEDFEERYAIDSETGVVREIDD